MSTASPFASASVGRHYLRGAIGLVALVAGFTGAALGIPAMLVLLLVTVAAWRGCPTCWAIGLKDTQKRCSADGCRTDVAEAAGPARQHPAS